MRSVPLQRRALVGAARLPSRGGDGHSGPIDTRANDKGHGSGGSGGHHNSSALLMLRAEAQRCANGSPCHGVRAPRHRHVDDEGPLAHGWREERHEGPRGIHAADKRVRLGARPLLYRVNAGPSHDRRGLVLYRVAHRLSGSGPR